MNCDERFDNSASYNRNRIVALWREVADFGLDKPADCYVSHRNSTGPRKKWNPAGSVKFVRVHTEPGRKAPKSGIPVKCPK